MKWTCKGSVRGECGVIHRTQEAAQRHCDQDATTIASKNSSGSLTRAYSDRYPVPLDAEAKAEAESAKDDWALDL